MAETIIEALWEYLKRCPLLKKYTVGVNFHTDDFDKAGIVEDNTEPVRNYLNGSSEKLLHVSLFLGAMSATDIQRIKTSSFLEELRLWFVKASRTNDLPQLPERYTAEDIRIGDAIPFEYGEDGQKCTYQMHIILDYIERNE